MCSSASSSRMACMALDLVKGRYPALEATMEGADNDGEVELTLRLSIGGSSRRRQKASAAPQGRATQARSGEAEAEGSGSGSSPSSSPRPPLPLPVEGEEDAALDQMRRRQIHALRRREARRKRDEKKQQQKGGISSEAPVAAAQGSCGAFPLPDDRLAMEARERQMRVKDRESRVEEALDRVPNHKLSAKHNSNPNDDEANSNPSFNPNACNPNNLVPFGAQSFPMVAMQYVSFTNGFGIPCVVPCWAAAMSPAAADGPGAEMNLFQPVACRDFQPCSPPVAEPANGGSPLNNNVAEENGGKGAGVERAAPSWTASQGGSSSPAASGHQGGSLRGGRSSSGSSSKSDGRSRWRHTQGKQHQSLLSLQQANGLPAGQSDNSISSRQLESDLDAAEEPPCGRRGGPTPCRNRSPSVNTPASAASPPQQAPPPQLPRMPCVSATGNGPNGRTITGVLYRYTKSEVSIVCACHGSSFSPAEFVEHAGGTDVTHPLKQITVVSS